MQEVWSAVLAACLAGAASAEPVFFAEHGPQVQDIHQGRLADCYLLSSLGAVALTRPELLLDGLKPDGHGGARVRLFLETPEGEFTPTWVPIDLQLGPEHAVTGNDALGHRIVWVAAYERAFAKWLERRHRDVQNNELTSGNGYRAIGDGGRPALILQALTGEVAVDVPVRQLGVDELRAVLDRPHGVDPSPVLASTLAYGPLGDVRPWHCYLVLGMTHDGNGVLVRDPAYRQGVVVNRRDPQLQIVSLENFRRWFAGLTLLRSGEAGDVERARVIEVR